MSRYQMVRSTLRSSPKTWLVTGAAGFIGSNLVECLLSLNQIVIGLDDFSTGHRHNLQAVERAVGSVNWQRFRFIEANICSLNACQDATRGVDYVLHQAALGSVPRSIEKPLVSFAANCTGFMTVMTAAREAGVKKFVYASSSSVYGDSPVLPKVEEQIGQPLSPYAATKYLDEVFAQVFARTYRMACVGLRYFNVYGPRQDPEGAYAAVIPKWTASLLRKQPVFINGDGQTSRDFCYIANTVQANILAAVATDLPQAHEVFNVACGEQTSLLSLFDALRQGLSKQRGDVATATPIFGEFRAGDVRHSLADIAKARRLLGYEPSHLIKQGLAEAMIWYVRDSERHSKVGVSC